MTKKSFKTEKPVSRPYLTGSPADQETFRNAARIFGTLLITFVMTFIVCSMTGFDSPWLRIPINTMICVLILFIFYHNGLSKGTDAVTRGEILYQRKEKGTEISDHEQRLCYHHLKGLLMALLGAIPFIIPAVILAFTTQRQSTGIGALPSWMNPFLRRSEIGDALLTYTQSDPMTFTELVRIIVRISIMPIVSMIGANNADQMVLAERLSPLIVLIPSLAYGIGYTGGRRIRTMIHTEIAENEKKRVRREIRRRKIKAKNRDAHQPEQLN